MKVFFDPRQQRHDPKLELHNGGFAPHAEHVGRMENALAALGETLPPADHGERPILAAHDADYVAFLKSAHAAWSAAGREGDAIGYTFPIVGRRPLHLERIDALLGRHSFDAGSPITPGTWEAAYWSAQAALSAFEAVKAGEAHAFALCRPPGHHSGRDYLGGYCYLNNAAIVAEAARASGRRRVAILDVDYHHGNGTQDIFYARGDVLFVSIHADPATDYPYYWGHADERGEGAGEGFTLNLPLRRGTTLDAYREALAEGLRAVAAFRPELLVVSFGADTFHEDPISHFALETGDFAAMAGDIGALGLPTVILMEGGYAVDALGANIASFLSGFADR